MVYNKKTNILNIIGLRDSTISNNKENFKEFIESSAMVFTLPEVLTSEK